tara:strand:+ start:275 stop:778 length:504 start_codon:yes stop_codon:yes gene_type:complete
MEIQMHKFKVGDIVEILDKNYSPLKLGRQYSVCRITACGNVEIHTQDATWVFEDSHLELIQDNKEQDMPVKEKKYKITTKLTLQQVYQLRCFTGQLNNMTTLFYETFDICQKELVDGGRIPRYEGDYNVFQAACAEVLKGKRKVVKVGDKEYYEDELSVALANIKSI